ncbi:uncharacterized protein BT62DRAFT_892563 [Guyanagaster necrorhizus]|uniref:Rap-GAP domain-containing protein n=1 Tax=Guyanagaster necrorhizus TaxID=856835 RepID=A0A9P7VVL1_9AGAR|nr:uncharacterized protein BT62DRAFT_892563 [Guyanagaster necrorhizus MCA 3950]KAG7447270.1 hypothetical protein BT62DRAFT_892563 [Guyanagaster necrorhizus MCA 3950]
MSRQDADTNTRSRPRANTNFAPFNWRRQRTEPSTPAQTTTTLPSLPLEALISALTPPSPPNTDYARALAAMLPTLSPLPPYTLLNPVLASLYSATSSEANQVAGFDILSAYWENHEAPTLGTADRISFFSFFLGSSISWSIDLWEPRFKALRALTKYGVEIVGIETMFLKVLKSWIMGAFEGLGTETISHREELERERSISVLSGFLTSIADKPEIVARISESELQGVVEFYAVLVDRVIDTPGDSSTLSPLPISDQVSHTTTPSRSPNAHRRHASSISISSLPSPTVSMSPSLPPTPHPSKQPADIAIGLYLKHLDSQMRSLSPSSLTSILPLLFRALAFCATPLPRLTVYSQALKKHPSEEKIEGMLDSLLAGLYSSTCIMILKQHLYPSPALLNASRLEEAQNGSPNRKDTRIDHREISKAIQTSFGAQRALRNHIRRALITRLARAYISRQSSLSYAHTGAPGNMDIEKDLLERAWPKDDVALNGWDASRVGRAMAGSVESWIIFNAGCDLAGFEAGKEKVLAEAAGTLKDILQELDERDSGSGSFEEEEANAVGETLYSLAGYVNPLVNADGTPFVVPLAQPNNAPTAFLRILSSLLARDHSTHLRPLLSSTLLHISDHLTDLDASRLPTVMLGQHDISPTCPDWLDNWRTMLNNPVMVSARRPITTASVMVALANVYDSVRDMRVYRRALADVVYEHRQKRGNESETEECEAMWKILGDEVVLRIVEASGEDESVDKFLDLLFSFAVDDDDEEDGDTVSVGTADTHSPSPQIGYSAPARLHGEYRDKDVGIMSIISSLAAGSVSRAQSIHPQTIEETAAEAQPEPHESTASRAVGAVTALISVFSQLSFTPFSLSNVDHALSVYDTLIDILQRVKHARVRLTVLQFFMRLRADRDHRVYFMKTGYDTEGQVSMLAASIARVREGTEHGVRAGPYVADAVSELRKARARMPHERRGRGASTNPGSRSRSRIPALAPPVKPRDPLWYIPEHVPFSFAEVDTPSEALITYDPLGPDRVPVLPISRYLAAICDILEQEKNWEILSYVLCHLSVQLANKHLFCGPKSRAVCSRMLTILCHGILEGDFAAQIDRWPLGLKIRDAHGLAYHVLSVLISYGRCFDLRQKHTLVEVFLGGLDGQPMTVKTCLHSLSITAFELQSSTTKYMSSILEKLSQIMSNPDMAVHILGFLSIIGSHPPLYSNFTDGDFKMVFGVALQYLQHYIQQSQSPTVSWALSQHVRILSYYLVYVWFLGVKVPDRLQHIPYITRQLLLANEGRSGVDNATEVCFDWLARYTYASADPRPANSLLSEMIMNPTRKMEVATSEKTWIIGNAIVTIRTLTRLGWIEVLSRRPSGYTKFLCRLENSPLVGPGDVEPDMMSVPAVLLADRNPPRAGGDEGEDVRELLSMDDEEEGEEDDDDDSTPRPDPVTGYVWSRTAPSQRRKEVVIDPAYFALQLSGYPQTSSSSSSRLISDQGALRRFLSAFDRMPVIDTHKVGILYVAPGQVDEVEILKNTHGSPAYTRFLEGIGRLIELRGQIDVYAGGLNPDDDGEYAYAWWDDIGQILYHTATMMPSLPTDPACNNKKAHIGNDFVRIVWNDGGRPYRFDTLSTEFQFVNIVVEPHSLGAIAAFSNNLHENEYFKVTVQSAEGMMEFAPVGEYRLVSAENLPLLVRQLSLLADWYASVFSRTGRDTERVEMKTNWQERLEAIGRFKDKVLLPDDTGDHSFPF